MNAKQTTQPNAPYEQGRQHYLNGHTTMKTVWCPWNSPSHEGAEFWAGWYAARREDQETKR